MNSKILDYINKCEGWKVAIKELHWDADNMSQHELCDDIASSISDFEDLVSEVEQSMSGKLAVNTLKPSKYKVESLKGFVEDIISSSKGFLKELDDMGENYVGIKSECETFIGDMQRKLYLVNFTLKEELKERLKAKINESMPKSLDRHDEVDKFMGRKPKSIKARINQIYRIVKKYGIDSKVYHDENWQAISDYYRAISSLGCEVEMKPCGHISNIDSMQSDGGYCDYAEDGMPRSKQYAIKIMFEDGMNIDGYIKCMAAGTVSDPFSRYDTCIVLWPKNNRMLENKEKMNEEMINEYGDTPEVRHKMANAAKRGIRRGDAKPYQNAMDSLNKRNSSKEELGQFQREFENENRQIKLSEEELKQLVKEAAMKVLSETPLNYDVDNFSGRWNKSEPSDEDWALANSYAEGDSLDNPFNVPNHFDDDEWVDHDKDMESDYSWDLYNRVNNVGKSPIDHQHDIMNAAQDRRDHAAYWTDRDNERGSRLMDKWVNGERDLDDLEDADFSYDPYKYNESKKPMKVTESELKDVLREATMKLIKEYGENVTNHIKRSHGRAKKTGNPILDRQEREKYQDRQFAKQRKQVEKAAKLQEEGSDIEIKPSKKGTFTAAATKHGESVQGFANKVLNNKDDYSPAMVKKANFAKNASKWKK